VNDPLDQPEPEGMSLVVPFIACTSHGGPFDDDAFVAGFQCGEIDKALATLAVTAGSLSTRISARWAVPTALLPQLELLAMNRGFMHIEAVEIGETEDHAAMPEWSVATFSTEAPMGGE